MADRFTIPTIFTYEQNPIPSEDVNANFQYVIDALMEIAVDAIGAVPPDEPVAGMIWMDTNYTPPLRRIYYDSTWVWNGPYSATVATVPTNPNTGAICLFTDLDTVKVYDGASWVTSGVDGGTP